MKKTTCNFFSFYENNYKFNPLKTTSNNQLECLTKNDFVILVFIKNSYFYIFSHEKPDISTNYHGDIMVSSTNYHGDIQNC